MSAPHKHAAVIRAYADGATIEKRHPSGLGLWRPVARPQFYEHTDYRVKPELTPDLVDAVRYGLTPVDPYAAVRAAQKAGQPVELNLGSSAAPQWEVTRIPLAFNLPPARYRVAALEPAKPTHFAPGTKVWCYPGSSIGFEGRVAMDPHPNYPDRLSVGKENGYYDLPKRSEVVVFDENHNQKRAYRQGKVIQAKLKPEFAMPSAGYPKEAENWNDCLRGSDCGEPTWSRYFEYRIKPDELAPIKAAFAEGKVIEARFKSLTYAPHIGLGPRWHRVTKPNWSKDHEYRVAPVKSQEFKFELRDGDHSDPARTVIVTLDVAKTGTEFTDIKVREFK